MVKITVIWVGKTKGAWIKNGISHYQKLLKRFADLDMIEIKEEKLAKSRPRQGILCAQAQKILRHIKRSGLCVALDAEAMSLGSVDFAHLLEKKLDQGCSELIFVLGGPLGLSHRVLNACPIRLSLSRMTFTHELSRVILLEQIYRAFSIIRGTGYHK